MHTLPRTSEGKFVKGFAYSPDTSFKPGNEPQNKGKKYPGSGNKTSFGKGNKPHNTLSDMAITIRTNNKGRSYKYIREAKGKWEFLQKHNWRMANGEIPEGMMIRCIDGDTLNCDPSNWELITKAENARRNRLECSLKPLTCETCKKVYESRSRRSKYCSAECRRLGNLAYMHNWHKNNPKTEQREYSNLSLKVKTCETCGNAYFPNSNVQKSCSDSCRTIAASLKKQAIRQQRSVQVLKEKHCSRCGQRFTPAVGWQTICLACKTKAPRKMNCIECGTEFTKQGKGVQLLCSDECKRARKNKLRAKYDKERKPRKLTLATRVCQSCSKEFVSGKQFRYCSDECRAMGKKNLQIDRRIRKKALVADGKKQIACNCKVCGCDFVHSRKVTICSDECRREQKRRHAIAYNHSIRKISLKPSRKVTEPKQVKQEKPILNRRNPKSEKQLLEIMPILNSNAPKNDGELIKQKNIESPDLSKMEYRIYDKRLRQTFFFKTEEKYLNYLKNNPQ